MPKINDIIQFLEAKRDKKTLNILNNEEDIILLKAYVKKTNLNEYIRIKELNRVLSVKDLLVLWLRFRVSFSIEKIADILDINPSQARSLIGNALINITRIDLTTNNDKCFFTSAKLPFYLSIDGRLEDKLDVSELIQKHISSCKFCKTNLKAFQESINSIKNLPVLEATDTEYVLYNKKHKSFLHYLLILFIFIAIISGTFVSPKFTDKLTPKKKATITNNVVKKQVAIIRNTSQKSKKQDSIHKKEPIKKVATKFYKTDKVTKLLAYAKITNIKDKINKLLSTYSAKHFGELDWGTPLNGGFYYHLLIRQDKLKDFVDDINKLGQFKKIDTKSKEQKLPVNYSRIVIWVSNK